MQRIGIELVRICDFHKISQIENSDLIADLLYHLQLMADKQVSKSVFFLKILKHLNDLCLERNIQRGNGLIADHKLRLHGKCPGNGNSLSLSAGKLMRIFQKILLFKANNPDQFFCTFFPLFWRIQFMDFHGLTDNILHGMTWVQG